MKTKISIKKILTLSIILCLPSCQKQDVPPPQAYGAIPSANQLAWQKMETYMFIHFGPNTFTDKEWGNGKEDPKVFRPTNLDCRQWAATAKAAGMTGIVITAKHHDGFCLWPSKYSTHTIRESGFEGGKGDILKDLSAACKEYGLKFGVYLSPWDRNHPTYGTPEYNQIFSNMLTEVLSQYGDVFEQWFDGACGEGPNGKVQVYDWDMFHNVVSKNAPHAVIFSDIGPGCRWIGNEEGYAGETNWSRLNVKGFGQGKLAPSQDTLNVGNVFGNTWVPGESDVSIRPGWFYSPTTDDKVKTVDQLMNIYYASVGRNSNLILNVPPDRTGHINAIDSIRLVEFCQAREALFKTNLANGATIKATSTRGNDTKYAASNLLDDNYDSYWATDDKTNTASLEVDLKNMTSFNRLMLQEYIPLGQRIAKFNVEYWNLNTKTWTPLTEATTIGYKRILRFPTVMAQKIRINILNSLACPVLNNLGIYKAKEVLSSPQIYHNKQGQVSLRCRSNDPTIYYTLDGSTPSTASTKYTGTQIDLSNGGMVKAIASINNGKEQSDVVSAKFDIAPTKWKVLSPKSKDVEKTIDGAYDAAVYINHAQALIVDMNELLTLKGFSYTPVNANWAANISTYNFYISADGKTWTKVKSKAMFNNIKNNPIQQDVLFDKTVQARYIKLEVLDLVKPSDTYTIIELGVITK